MLASVVGKVLGGAFWLEFTICVVEVLPLIFLALALKNWKHFSVSRSLVLGAWFTAFVSPFVVSIVPMRLMLNFDSIDEKADYYVRELAVAMHLDQAQEILMSGCKDMATGHFDRRVWNFKDALRKTCRNLANFPTHLVVPCVHSFSLCRVDLSQAMDGCRQSLQQFDAGHVELATKLLEKQCVQIEGAFMGSNTTLTGREGQQEAFKEVVSVLSVPLHTLVPSVEVISITVSALHAFFMVLPAVLGVAPGFMRAGLTTKILMPHSELPGAMLFAVPIILTNAAWLACTVIFQYISGIGVLVQLMVVLCCLLAFIYLAAYYKVTWPIPPRVLLSTTHWFQVTSAASVVLAALFCIRIGIELNHQVKKVPGLQELMDWCQVSWARLAFACSIHVLYFFLLTSFGASDWMMLDISVQLQYWKPWLSNRTCTGKAEEESRSGGSGFFPSEESRSSHGETPEVLTRRTFQERRKHKSLGSEGSFLSEESTFLPSEPRFEMLNTWGPVPPPEWVWDQYLQELLVHRKMAWAWETAHELREKEKAEEEKAKAKDVDSKWRFCFGSLLDDDDDDDEEGA